MTQSWYDAMVRASWQGALLVALLWLVLNLWKRSTPASRTWLWMIATAKFVLVLVFIVEVPVLAPVVTNSVGSGSLESSITYAYGAPPPSTIDWMPVLFWAWLFGVFAIVARAFSDHARLGRLSRESVPADGRVQGIWEEVSTGAKASVRVHPDAPVPLVFGLLRPQVLLPQRLVAQLSDGELRMVLSHEAAHVRRRDTVASLYMFVCFVLFYFHPAVWLARREWQLDREAACDKQAIESTGSDAHGYAAMLLKVSAGADRAPVLALSAVPTYRTLQRRINEMKSTNKNRRSGRVVWALLALLVSAGAVPVVLTQRQPHFGSGVFETKWPGVKVTQALKGKQTRAVEPAAIATASTGPAMVADKTTTAYAAAPAGVAQTMEPTQIQSPGAAVLAPSGGVATAIPTPAMTGQAGATSVPSAGGIAKAADGRPMRVSGQVTEVRPAGGYPATVRPTTVTTAGDTRATYAGSAPLVDVTTIAPTSDVYRSTVTIVMRDKQAKGGSGLDTLVSIELDDVAVADFFKFLSSVTKVRITTKGLRSGMRMNAQIENTTLGEVMGTLAKVYGLEWRLEGDGSIRVEPK